MLWRRGRGIYRPLVPFTVDLAELESRPEAEWEQLEVDETHFEWQLRPDAGDPLEQIEDVVEELWDVAVMWTGDSGKWCDFQLVAFDGAGRVLFEDGCRCWLNPPASRGGSGPRPGATDSRPSSTATARVSVDYRAINELEGRKDRFIDRLSLDRNWSFDTAQQAMNAAQRAMSSAPGVLGQVGNILEQTITYQQEVVEEMHRHAAESTETQMHTVSEREQTKRKAIRAELIMHAFDKTATTMVPVVKGVMELLANRRADKRPTFRRAQQAMMYLRRSLAHERLLKICKGDERLAGAMLTQLEDAAKFHDEGDALDHIDGVVGMFRTSEFERYALGEELHTARYLLGRYAMHKANSPGPDPMDPPRGRSRRVG